jgi:hypothetical protein
MSGQAQRPAAGLDEVVNELRALRADLRLTTRASTQMQLLTARLALQEQRLAVLSNQRQIVVTKLTEERRVRAEFDAKVAQMEEVAARNLPAELPRDQFEYMLNDLKRQAASHRDAEQQLRAEESQLSTEIANEQSRWTDFNNRLDELERSLR